jgi:hypothetical protein
MSGFRNPFFVFGIQIMDDSQKQKVESSATSVAEVEKILNSLCEQEKVLVTCTYELYDGRWDLILHDLVARLEGRPYVFSLGERIRDDIERVGKLRQLEEKMKVKLGDYIRI